MSEPMQLFSDDFLEQLAERVAARVLRQIDKTKATPWPEYMPIETAARYIGHSKRSFEYLLAKNLFPVIRRDRLILIHRKDIDAALERLKQ
jgi:hypothetical protein